MGGEVISAPKQDRVYGATETPTDGCNLLKLFASYSFMTGRPQFQGRLWSEVLNGEAPQDVLEISAPPLQN